jgi:hypothetical protein
MQREQPGKERQGETRWNEKKRRSPSLEDQKGQIAPNNLSDCRKDEKQCGPNHDSGTGINRCSHFNPPQDTTPAEPPAWGIRPYRLEKLNKKEKASKELLIFLVIYASASSTKTN